MTTIAWDGKTLAGDRLVTGGVGIGSVQKVHRIDGHLVGCSGQLDLVTAFLHVFRESGFQAACEGLRDSNFDGEAQFNAIVVTPDARAWKLWATGVPVQQPGPFSASGSGAEYAYGAMMAGKSAAAAVEIASKCDERTGGGVDKVRLAK